MSVTLFAATLVAVATLLVVTAASPGRHATQRLQGRVATQIAISPLAAPTERSSRSEPHVEFAELKQLPPRNGQEDQSRLTSFLLEQPLSNEIDIIEREDKLPKQAENNELLRAQFQQQQKQQQQPQQQFDAVIEVKQPSTKPPSSGSVLVGYASGANWETLGASSILFRMMKKVERNNRIEQVSLEQRRPHIWPWNLSKSQPMEPVDSDIIQRRHTRRAASVPVITAVQSSSSARHNNHGNFARKLPILPQSPKAAAAFSFNEPSERRERAWWSEADFM